MVFLGDLRECIFSLLFSFMIQMCIFDTYLQCYDRECGNGLMWLNIHLINMQYNWAINAKFLL